MAPSRALVPIAPISPRSGPGIAPQSPLQRSGIDLLNLLDTADRVATRSAVAPGELEIGLEQARSSLVRQLPGEALAALDGIWERARRTEEGWFLRSGALIVLGLPGEGDRVAAEGLQTAPTSLALRFGQSLARLALGDVTGARQLLQAALDRSPDDPLLLVQHAVTLARQGQRGAADAELQRVAQRFPEHPAVHYGRAAMRTIMADRIRGEARTVPADLEGFRTFGAGQRIAPASTITDEPLGGVRVPDAGPLDGISLEAGDVAEQALRRLGARLASPDLPQSTDEVVRDARMLLRAFTVGGTLASIGTPEQSHAARSVLTGVLGVLTGAAGADREAAGAPLPGLIAVALPALREGRAEDAERMVRRAGARIPDGVHRLLLALVQGDARSVETGASAGRSTPVFSPVVVKGEVDQGPIVPVRLGLALLEETSGMRAARWRDDATWDAAALGAPQGSVGNPRGTPDTFIPSLQLTGSSLPAVRDDVLATGWGAAMVAGRQPSDADDTDVAIVRAVALLCVVVAAVAAFSGYGVMAIALGAGAAWLGIRRSARADSDASGDQTGRRRD